MRHAMNKHKAGLVVGIFFGVWHLAWVLLVAGGWAQPFMDWIFRLHFIQPPYHITPFILRDAALLILLIAHLNRRYTYVRTSTYIGMAANNP